LINGGGEGSNGGWLYVCATAMMMLLLTLALMLMLIMLMLMLMLSPCRCCCHVCRCCTTFVIRLRNVDGGIRAKDDDDGLRVVVVGYPGDGGNRLSQ